MSEELEELTQQERLERELNRLSDLIDDVADGKSEKSKRQALQQAAQLARLRERLIDRREPETQPEPKESISTSRAQKLEAIRNLKGQLAGIPHRCPECGADLDKYAIDDLLKL